MKKIDVLAVIIGYRYQYTMLRRKEKSISWRKNRTTELKLCASVLKLRKWKKNIWIHSNIIANLSLLQFPGFVKWRIRKLLLEAKDTRFQESILPVFMADPMHLNLLQSSAMEWTLRLPYQMWRYSDVQPGSWKWQKISLRKNWKSYWGIP